MSKMNSGHGYHFPHTTLSHLKGLSVTLIVNVQLYVNMYSPFIDSLHFKIKLTFYYQCHDYGNITA
jgi:hypothetical protein